MNTLSNKYWKGWANVTERPKKFKVFKWECRVNIICLSTCVHENLKMAPCKISTTLCKSLALTLPDIISMVWIFMMAIFAEQQVSKEICWPSMVKNRWDLVFSEFPYSELNAFLVNMNSFEPID